MSLRFVLALAALLPAMSLAQAAQVEVREEGALVMQNVPATPDDLRESLQRYQSTRSALVQGWLPSGALLVSTRFGNTDQLHEVKAPGGARRQLTFFDEPVTTAVTAPSPRVGGFLYLKDQGGDEFAQIYFYDLARREARLLTDGRSLNGPPVWSKAGDRFAYYSTRRNGADWDLWVGTVAAATEARMVSQREGAWIPLAFSPDDKRLLVMHYVSIAESSLHVLELETGETNVVRERAERVAHAEQAAWSRDGKSIYFASDEGSEFLTLRRYHVATGRQRALTVDIPWDVSALERSPVSEELAVVVNEEGASRLYLVNGRTGARRSFAKLPIGRVRNLRFSPDGKRLAFTIDGAATPGDAYVLELAGGRLTPWTQSEVGGLDRDGFATPELIHYPSFDGKQIPAFVYRPEGKGPVPTVILIHGGPESQYQPTFSPFLQFLVRELGVAVIAPNVRGSSGYGKTWLTLDNGLRREDSVKDIGALLDWIGTEPTLDASRVAVYGGSYGGYMVLAALAHYPERLRGGVDVVGIANFVTFLENTESYRRDLRRAEYGDERDPEMRAFLTRISPASRAGDIKSPLFVVQGANDPRVPASESEQIVAEVRRHGSPAWYMLAKDEGHGFRKKTNRDRYYEATALFLRRFLLAE